MLNNQLNQFEIDRNNSDAKKNLSIDLWQANQAIKNIDFELIIETLDYLFLEEYARSLNTVERLLLAGIWQRKTYSTIAKEHNYSSDYFSNVAAPKLFKKLSKLVQCRVTKKNCRFLLAKHVASFIED